MIDKSELHSRQYRRIVRRSPHGFLISFVYKTFKRWAVHPNLVILRSMRGGETMLDIGCGDGSFCLMVGNYFKRIIGIDVAKDRIQLARQDVYNPDKYKFLVGDMDSKLKFKSSTFDAVTAIAAFQYCYDPYFTLSEIHRILKPGGRLYIQVTNLAWIVYRLQLFTGNQIITSLAYKGIWDGGVLHYFTFDSLSKLLIAHGFKIKSKTCSGLLRGIKMLQPELLASDIIICAER